MKENNRHPFLRMRFGSSVLDNEHEFGLTGFMVRWLYKRRNLSENNQLRLCAGYREGCHYTGPKSIINCWATLKKAFQYCAPCPSLCDFKTTDKVLSRWLPPENACLFPLNIVRRGQGKTPYLGHLLHNFIMGPCCIRSPKTVRAALLICPIKLPSKSSWWTTTCYVIHCKCNSSNIPCCLPSFIKYQYTLSIWLCVQN